MSRRTTIASCARALPLAVALVAITSCGHGVTLRLEPTARVNEGRHFVVMVRTVTESEFLTDTYTKIADMVFAAKQDPSVVLVQVVRPGEPEKVYVEVPEDQAFAIYVMFTEPGEPWKTLVTPPHAGEYAFVLDGGRIVEAVSED